MAQVRMYQRPAGPARKALRPNKRWARQRPSTRGHGSTDDHGGSDTPVTATGATAGTPGVYTPTGAALPANLGALVGITATPTSAWTTGQYVLLADETEAHWVGAAWGAGRA